MMIDGIRAKGSVFTQPANIGWVISVSEETGELINGKTARLHGLKIVQKGSNFFIRGSLHKYHNNGHHNYDDFDYVKLQNAILDLCKTIQIQPAQVYLEGLEFGYNLNVKNSPRNYLASFISHKGKPFYNFSDHVTKGKSAAKVCNHTEYSIKAYDKGLQYGLDRNILRIEISVRKMRFFSKKGLKIETLADLTIDNLIKLDALLFNMFDEILMCDNFTEGEIGTSEKKIRLLIQGRNPEYWQTNLPDSRNYRNGNMDKNYKSDRTRYYRRLTRFNQLAQSFGLNSSKEEVLSLLLEERKQLHRNTLKENVNKFTTNQSASDQSKGKQYHTETIVENSHTCQVTGLDISMQKPGSRFLCTTGIRHYMAHEPGIWHQLNMRLSEKWDEETIDVRIREIHHSIRNEYYNSIRDLKKVISRPVLFDTAPFVISSKQKYLIGINGKSSNRNQYYLK